MASEELALALCYGFALPLFYLGLGSLVSMPGYGTLGIPLAFGAVALVECGRHITPDGASIDPVGDLPRRIASYALFLPAGPSPPSPFFPDGFCVSTGGAALPFYFCKTPCPGQTPLLDTGLFLRAARYPPGRRSLLRRSLAALPQHRLVMPRPEQKTAQLALRITLLTAPIAAALFLFSPLTSCILGLLIGFTGRAAGSQPL